MFNDRRNFFGGEGVPRYEAIQTSRGRAFVVRNALAYWRREGRGGVLVTPERTPESSSDGGGIGVSWRTYERGRTVTETASADYGQVLTIRSGSMKVVIHGDGSTTERTLTKDGAVFIGKGVSYEWEALTAVELVSARTPASHYPENNAAEGSAVFIDNIWETGKDYHMYFVGHFIPPGVGAHSLDIEAKAQHSTLDNPASMGRTVPSTSQYGSSMVMLVEGTYRLSLQLEPDEEFTTYELRAGDVIFWDNRIPHTADADPGAKQLFFRTPSLQPNTTPVA